MRHRVDHRNLEPQFLIGCSLFVIDNLNEYVTFHVFRKYKKEKKIYKNLAKMIT
jgi:hypothetical protein